MPAQTVFIVAHTHWDREWYRTFQEYRVRLVDVMDALLDLLQAQPEYTSFLLDGQTILLDDYLALRPERLDDLRNLAQAGRLELGPWYVQPDETLVAGESLMRNLCLGRRSAAAFSRSCDCGWLPDTFGHIAQLPQILHNFGIDTLVLTRGLGDQRVPPHGAFWLQGPDGRRVLAVHQRGGYVNGGNLGHASFWGPADPAATNLDLAAQQIDCLVSTLDPRGEGGPIAVWNGADHTPAQPDLPAVLAHLRYVFPQRAFEHTSLAEYLARLKAADLALPVVEGELRGSRHQPLLAGVLSARMPLKQANAVTERALLRYAEPLATLAWLAGADYPHAALWAAWRLALQNQCHDSICGCHIDRVTEEMMCRNRQAEDLVGALIERATHVLTLVAAPASTAGCYPLLLQNTLPHPRWEITRTCVRLPRVSPNYVIGDGAVVRPVQILSLAPAEYEWLHGEVSAGELLALAPMWQASLGDIDGLGLGSHTVERQDDVTELTLWLVERAWANEDAAGNLLAEVASWPPQTRVSMRARYYEMEFAFDARSAGLGATACMLRESENGVPLAEGRVVAGPYALANELVRVAVDDHGRIMLHDLVTHRDHGPLCLFEDSADAGDTYDYSPLPGAASLTLAAEPSRIEVLAEGPLSAALRIEARFDLPQGLSDDRKSRSAATAVLPVSVTLRLDAGSPVLDIMVELGNAAREHRLRALFRTGISADTTYSGAQFGVSARPVGRSSAADGRDSPAGAQPHLNWVGVVDTSSGLAIVTDGLPEHEAFVEDGQTTLAITLLRCVGYLSRGDLTTRRGHAGPAIPTPTAQCLGTHTYRLAVAPVSRERWASATNLAESFLAPMRVAPLSAAPADALPFLTLTPDHLALSSLCVSDDGGEVVARFYNPTSEPAQAVLRFGLPVRRVDRSDAGVRAHVPPAGNAQQYGLQIGPAEIVTVLVTA